MSPRRVALAGIFVGGASRRMGGAPKGLLPAPTTGEPLVVRWASLAGSLGLGVVLVGAAGPYRHLGFEALEDDPPGVGPLGGLRALLARAGQGEALALACDLPFVSVALLERLCTACPGATAVAPRLEGRWEPLCARYGPGCLPSVEAGLSSGRYGLQGVLTGAHAEELPLGEGERALLRDWDTPEDVARDRG